MKAKKNRGDNAVGSGGPCSKQGGARSKEGGKAI